MWKGSNKWLNQQLGHEELWLVIGDVLRKYRVEVVLNMLKLGGLQSNLDGNLGQHDV